MAKQTLLLEHKLALGDTVLFTGLARDIQLNHPGQYEILVSSNFRGIWQHNPHARPLGPQDTARRHRLTPIKISYLPGIKAAGRGNKIHMLSQYHREFTQATGIRCPLRFPKGDLHFSAEDKKPIIEGRYWVIQAGGKLDMTNKFWWIERYQQVVDRLLKLGIHCVQSGVRHSDHRHPDLDNCLNIIGKYTTERDFMNLIYHSEGFIGPITAGMHIAACFDKPCVVVAGGREEPWWEAYTDVYGAFGGMSAPVKTDHRFLHTVGLLHCCESKGCWKKRVVPITPQDTLKDADKLCVEPLRQGDQAVARCMDMITVDHVVEAVMSYYERGELPPIGQTKGKYPHDEEFEEPKLVDPANLPPVIKNPPLPPKPRAVREPQARPVPMQRPVLPTPVNAPAPPQLRLIENPIVGGKYTVCVLCYGPHTDLAKRCLGSIFDSTPAELLDVRVACNECSPDTLKYLNTLPLTKLYVNNKNRKKYPVMREMFWDKTCPINTNYVLWFDDDTQIVDPNWLVRLTEMIVANHPHGNRMFGWRMHHNMAMFAKNGNRPDQWFRRGDWFQGKNFRIRGRNTEAPNGTVVEFAVGWFWALAIETIRRGNIPDVRLNHNGGDITIGEQVHQAGAKIKMWNKDKTFVWCPPKEGGGRRGYSETFPWAP